MPGLYLHGLKAALICFPPAVIYALLGIPLAFWGWYLSIYDAAASNSTLGYVKFFICFSINIGFCVWSAIAPQISTAAWSFAGWLTAFKALGINRYAPAGPELQSIHCCCTTAD